jgi:hypothetical protein
MLKVVKNIPGRWIAFSGYVCLFLLMAIAALQIYDANYKITNRYKQLAIDANSKLTLLLEGQEDQKSLDAITKEIKIQETAADTYFKNSIRYINILMESES